MLLIVIYRRIRYNLPAPNQPNQAHIQPNLPRDQPDLPQNQPDLNRNQLEQPRQLRRSCRVRKPPRKFGQDV